MSKINKYVSKEVFDAISNKNQNYMAKLNCGFWKDDVKVGDTVNITDGERLVEIIITQLSYFSDFGDAWFTYGDKLVPTNISNIITPGDAVRYYRKYYKDEDVNVCGVVVFKIEPNHVGVIAS
jgi:ASC-1-like (ASCH) protein